MRSFAATKDVKLMSKYERGNMGLMRRFQRRRARRQDPEQRRLDREWRVHCKATQRAQARLREAGFFDADHYDKDGPRYCQCGSVADHNQRFDELRGVVYA
jgi:hypothetical protein